MTSENNRIIIHALKNVGLLPVFNHYDVDAWYNVIKAAYRCGIRVLEFSHIHDSRGIRLFKHLVEYTQQYPGLALGAGTVLDARAAGQYLQAGAQFIASPFLYKDMAEICYDHGCLWIPGCSTLAEIAMAEDLQAKVISVLPGNSLSPDTIALLTQEYAHMHFIPSGGIAINQANFYQWLNAGVLCLRMGLSIFPKGTIAIKDWVRIEQNISETLTRINSVKNTTNQKNQFITDSK